MQKKLFLIFTVLAIFFLTVVLTGELYAQDITSPLPSDNTTGFDWRWLVPLLAVPVLFFLLKDSSLNDYPDDRYLSGQKGGKARRDPQEHRREFGEEDDEE